MQIHRSDKFEYRLFQILDYIAQDKLNSAIKFNRNLQNQINKLVYFPYKFRKSFYYDNENIRDLIFKGYTIPYLIDKKNNKIVILDIFKMNKR